MRGRVGHGFTPYPPAPWIPPSLPVPHCAGLDCALTPYPPTQKAVLLPYPPQISKAAVVNDSKAILKCIISRTQKACSCTSSTTGAAYAASGAWRA